MVEWGIAANSGWVLAPSSPQVRRSARRGPPAAQHRHELLRTVRVPVGPCAGAIRLGTLAGLDRRVAWCQGFIGVGDMVTQAALICCIAARRPVGQIVP